MLINNDANPNLLDKDKYSPLGIALREDNFKAAYKLLKEEKTSVNEGAGLFCGILHLAVGKLDGFVVEKCI
jgi:hypothetical protein